MEGVYEFIKTVEMEFDFARSNFYCTWYRFDSLAGMMMPSEKVPSTNMITVMAAPMNTHTKTLNTEFLTITQPKFAVIRARMQS